MLNRSGYFAISIHFTPILKRRHPCLLFENAGKMLRIFKPKTVSNFAHGFVLAGHFFFCNIYQFQLYELMG